MAYNPIHQFTIEPIIPIHVGGLDFSFTNSSLFMVLTVLGAVAFLLIPTSPRKVVPRPLAVRRRTHLRVRREDAPRLRRLGRHALLSIRLLVVHVHLVANLWGMFPYFFTVTSHIIVTAALAIAVILTVIVYGFAKNGLHFFKLFVPSGVP